MKIRLKFGEKGEIYGAGSVSVLVVVMVELTKKGESREGEGVHI